MVPAMHRHRSLAIALVAVAALVSGACASGTEEVEGGGTEQTLTGASAEGAVEVAMVDAGGADVGTVTLTPAGGAIRVEADLEGLEPGFHGFHVHDVGLCEADAPDGAFTTATGHYVGEGATHGDHDGDMPSLYVTEDGRASLAATLDAFTIEELTEGDGAAVMVHAGADNFANVPDRYTSSESGQPGADDMTNKTGDAGARAACGVVGAQP